MKRIPIAVLTALLFAWCTGCGAQTVSLTGTGVTPTVPGILVTPSAIAFGSVNTGSKATQNVSVKSTGTANLVVSSLTIGGPTFTLTAPPTLPLTIPPGQTTSLSVAFSPTIAGNVSGALSVFSDATTSPVPTVALSGVATPVNALVFLTWDPPVSSTDPVVSYNVYRGVSGTGIYQLLNFSPVTTASYTDTAVPTGSWDYIVKSVDAVGTVSAPSNIFSAVIP